MSIRGPLTDRFGRVHSSLRISVTDRCNIRCLYCMPDDRVRFKPRHEILSFEEIERFVRVVIKLGVNRLRITGGEPLTRSDLPTLVRNLAGIPGLADIAMTTNGILLSEYAVALKRAGLRRLNISLDGLSEGTFRRITRRDGLDRVLHSIALSQQLGFDKIRLNAVAIRGITEDEIIPLGEFARTRGLELRFIGFMPLDAEGQWQADKVLAGAEIRARLEDRFGPLVPVQRDDPSQPAIDFEFADGVGRIGFINPITQPFCIDCNRLRITAEGKVHNCLFEHGGWDVRALLRHGATDQQVADLVKACVEAKDAGHHITSKNFIRPKRAMYELGG